MRVSARRLRAVLRGFGRVLDQARTREAADELRWLGVELSAERDTEVMDERFTRAVQALPEDLVLGPVRADLTRAMQSQAVEARTTARAALDSDRYLALQDLLDQLLADPPLTRRARKAGRTELPKNVARAFRELDRRMSAAAATPAGPDRDVALHGARKAAKRVRYVTEVVAPAVGGSADRLVRRMKTVQSLLGEHQDTVVARPVLRRLGAAAHVEGQNGFTYGLLHANERARAEQIQRELPGSWERARDRRATKWLR
jgi:CHAD domain-containing protein